MAVIIYIILYIIIIIIIVIHTCRTSQILAIEADALTRGCYYLYNIIYNNYNNYCNTYVTAVQDSRCGGGCCFSMPDA